MTEEQELTDEQKQMWKRLSEPYVPPYTYGGNGNIMIGYNAVVAMTTGTQNVAIGYKAMVEDAK